jgi:hypothetical protein
MNNKERTGIKQTQAEIFNISRKIKHLKRTGETVPVTLYERKNILEQKLSTRIM